MTFIYLLLMLVCVLMSVKLWRSRYRADHWLAAFIAFLAAYLGLIILDAQDFYIAPQWYLSLLSMLFLPGPMLLAYISHISSRAYIRATDFMICVVPWFLVLCFGDYLTLDATTLSDTVFATKTHYQHPIYHAVFNSIAFLAGFHFLVYLLLVVKVLWQTRLDWEQYQSQNLPHSWFNMLQLLVVILIVAALQLVSALLNTAGDGASVGDLSFVALVLYFIYLALSDNYRQVNEVTIAQPPLDSDYAAGEPQLGPAITVQSTPRQDQEQQDLAQAMRELMETQQLYLRSDLSLATLGELMQLSTHKCSQLINSSLGLNFYEFVNGYRVEFAAQALTQKPYRSITEVFYNAGFTSKSTFYSCFKKRFDCTPSEYRKQAKALDD